MPTLDASKLLRPGLLEGVSILLAGAPAGGDRSRSFADAVRAVCTGLGARACELNVEAQLGQDDGAVESAVDEAVGAALADDASIELLVLDSASLFAPATGANERSPGEHDRPGGAREALRACLDLSWNATRAVANVAFMPDARGGRIVYIAPPADAGEYADAARAGLENLARTLSIEWARHSITAVAIAPALAAGGGDVAGQVAALTAYLASPAGAYFSGCLLDLRGGRGAAACDHPPAAAQSLSRSSPRTAHR